MTVLDLEAIEASPEAHSVAALLAEIRRLRVALAEAERSPSPATLRFFVAQLPKKKNNLKPFRLGNHVRMHYPKETKQAQDTLAARVLEHKPATPFMGPVRLAVIFVLPVPATAAAWKKIAALEGRVYPWKRPDRGNLLKLFEDALAGPFYLDDAQVVDGNVGKRYGEVPGYWVTIEPLEEAEAPRKRPKGI